MKSQEKQIKPKKCRKIARTYNGHIIEVKISFLYNIVLINIQIKICSSIICERLKGGNMFTILSDHIILTGLILLFLLSSIVCQIISAVIYQNMINQSDNMSSTENKILKQCKQKYAGYYKLNGKMVNTSVFVDKFLHKIRIGG